MELSLVGTAEGFDEPAGSLAVVHATSKAAIATQVRCFSVTGTPPGPLFLEWLTCARKLWFA